MSIGQINIAILIDCDNVSHKYAQGIFNDITKYGTVNIKRAYGNWKSKSLGGWEKVLQKYNIQPIQQFDYTKGKNATDIAMTIDSMDLLYTKSLQGVALVTSDSDFTPIATRIMSDGLTVYGYGESKTLDAFINACSQFIYVEKLSIKNESSNISKKANSSNQIIEEDNEENIQEDEYSSLGGYKGNNYNVKKDKKLQSFLINAVYQTSTDNDWSDLKDVGSYIKQNSSFAPINYGFNKLGDLIKEVDIFEIEYTNNKLTMLVREKY